MSEFEDDYRIQWLCRHVCAVLHVSKEDVKKSLLRDDGAPGFDEIVDAFERKETSTIVVCRLSSEEGTPPFGPSTFQFDTLLQLKKKILRHSTIH